MHGVAREFSDALNREVTYSDIPAADWQRELKKLGLLQHLTRHLVTMGELHRAGRYERLAVGGDPVAGLESARTRQLRSLQASAFAGRRSYDPACQTTRCKGPGTDYTWLK